jgi:hypothetical protein
MAGPLDLIKKIGGAGGGAIGIAANAAGSVFDVIGAFGQKKEAQKQLAAGDRFAQTQKLDLQENYSDLFSLANKQAVYKGDLSKYDAAAAEAKKQQMLAQNANPADELYRENARQGSADYTSRARQGAQSGSDIMSIAANASGRESADIRAINAQSANQRYAQGNSANANVLNTMGQLAGADTAERGREFSSQQQKDSSLFGLTQQKGQDTMQQNYSLFQDMLARQGALQDAKTSIMSGFGDIFRSVGGGIQSNNDHKERMAMYSSGKPQYVAPVRALNTPITGSMPSKQGVQSQTSTVTRSFDTLTNPYFRSNTNN